jgi:hypothetical protein
MPDEVITEAARTLNSSVLGACLVLTLVVTFFVVRALRQDIKDLQARLDAEKLAHDRTREMHLDDIRKTHNLAIAIDDMRSSLVERAVGRDRV